MRTDLWTLLTENRERLACAAACLFLALTLHATVSEWRALEPLGQPKDLLPESRPLPAAAFPSKPLASYWVAGGRDPFQPAGRQLVARGPAELPFPPLPPVAVTVPPPADPAPALYRGGARSQGCLLTFVGTAETPVLKSGRACTIKPRPHDIVQARGDPAPTEGKVRREEGGKAWFYDLRGIGHPRNPLVAADLLVLKRQTRTVQEAYQERMKEAAGNADAHFALAKECFDGDLAAEAEAELRKAVELNPKHRAAHLKLADLYITQGKRDAEIAVYEAALAAGADFPEIRARLGQHCFELDLFRLAAEHFSLGFQAAANATVADVVAKRKPLPDDPLARLLLRKAAEVAVLDARLDEATHILERLAEASPDDPAARNVQAVADILAGRGQQAFETLRQVVQAPKPPPSAHNNLGALHFAAGRYDAALDAFLACRAAAPRHTKAALNAALAQAAAGKLPEAQKLLDEAGTAPAASVHYQLVVAYLRERQGRHEEAIAAYQGALAVDRASFHALCGLGRCHLAKGELGPATERFAAAALLRPDDPEALRGVGTALHRAAKFAEAADVFRQLVAKDGAPKEDLARLGVASVYLQDQRRDAAALFERAIADAREPDPYALAGRAYLAYAGVAGTAEQAEALFRKAQASPAPEVSQYAAQALRRIFVARREEFTTYTFQGDETAKLPEGWLPDGQGAPGPLIRQNALHFNGRSAQANVRAIRRRERTSAPTEDGFVRTFARVEANARSPLTNQAAVGLFLASGDAHFQLAVRTTTQPQPGRRLAYRTLKGQEATPWTDLPGSVALDDFKLGLGLSDRGEGFLDVFLDGRTVGAPVEWPELRAHRDELDLGVFVAVEPNQECFYSVREIEIIWKKATAGR